MFPEGARRRSLDDLVELADPTWDHLVHDLIRLERATPPPPHLRAEIARALADHAVRDPLPSRLHRWPVGRSTPRRLVVVAASLLMAFVLAGATLAIRDVLERALNMEPTTRQIAALDLAQPVGLARTVDGFTVTVEQVYADPIQVVVGYTIRGPADRSFSNFHPFDLEGADRPTLLDADGNSLPHGPMSWGAGVEEGTGGYVEVFDGADLPEGRQQVALRFEIPAISVIEQVKEATADLSLARGKCETNVCWRTVSGPFVFDMTVPVAVGRAVELRMTAKAGNSEAVLERVVTTKIGTRVDLRGIGPDAEVVLSAGDGSVVLDPPRVSPSDWNSEQIWSYTTSQSLLDEHGTWSVTVQPSESMNTQNQSMEVGSLSFQFVVPGPEQSRHSSLSFMLARRSPG